jgi:hypothetical protein
MRAYHSALSPARWLRPFSSGKRRSLRNAIRTGPQRPDRIRPAR